MFWYPVRWAVQRLPRGLAYAIACGAGILQYSLARGKRRIMCEELTRVLPSTFTPRQIRSLVRRGMILHCKNQVEVLLYPVMNRAMMEAMTTVDGLAHVEQALQRGKGAILALMHFGNNQMIMPALGYRGYKIAQMSAPATAWENLLEHRSRMSRQALVLRTAHENSLPAEHINVLVSIRPAFRCLRQNLLLGFAVDGGGGAQHVVVNFLNRSARLPPGAIDLAMRTGAALLPIFVIRQADNTQRIAIEPPVELEETGDKERDVQVNMQKFSDIATRYFYTYPDHYVRKLWMARHRAGKDPFGFFTDDSPSARGSREGAG